MAPRWSYVYGPVEDDPAKKLSDVSADNIIEGSAKTRTRNPPGGASINLPVQESEINGPDPDREQTLHGQPEKRKNGPQSGIESTTAEPSRDTHSMGKKGSDFHSDMPMMDGVPDSERLATRDEHESVIVFERTPKRAKTMSRSSQSASPAKALIFQASEVNELERTLDGVNSAKTSPLGFGLLEIRSTGVSSLLPNKAFYQGLKPNNSATSISQRSRPTSPSTGFHGQRTSLDDSQYTSPLLDQAPQQKLRSSFQQTTPHQLRPSFQQSRNTLQDKSGLLLPHESSTLLSSKPAFSRTALDSSNSTRNLPDSKSISSFQVSTSTAYQQDQRANPPSMTNAKDMAGASIRPSSAIELDGESSSGLSDLDSEEFAGFEEEYNLNSPTAEPAVGQDSSIAPAKSRPARQKKPTPKALEKQKQQMPKKARVQSPKDMDVLQKAKATTKKIPVKPKLPKGATRASERKKVEEKDEKDDYQPEKGLGFAISESGMGLRDRSTLKAPATSEDRIAATADLMQRPGTKTGMTIVVSTKKTGKTRATRALANPSNIRTPTKKKSAPSASRPPGRPRKPLPKSNKSAEPRLSPHDSGFSEVASTDDGEEQSDFAPPSSSSSDSPQASSIVSLSSPEEDAEDDIVEPSSPEVVPQRVRKVHRHLSTNITVKEADARTDPPVGPELLALAITARNNGRIAKRWNPEVARFVDGIWMAPDKCDSCQDDGCIDCDRAFPCYPCVKKGKNCNVRTSMKITACNSNPRDDGAITPLHLNAPIVSQNGDGIWNATKQTPPTIRPKKRKRADTSKETVKSRDRRAVATTRDKRLNNGSSRSREVLRHMKAPHTFQNPDATWNLTEQAPPTSSVDKRKRKYAGSSEATGNPSAKKQHRSPPSGYSSSEETNLEAPANRRQARVRSKKEPGASRTYIPYHQSNQENLPAPYGQPPVWASKRQQLCETLPYYRAYMSGGYLHDGLVRAILIDKETRERDIFDEEVVITRCGGGRTLDEVTGKMIQSTNQEKNAYGLGFERARDLNSQGNSKSPSKLPHYYNVLDWFYVTDVWMEKIEGFKTWCVRLEKVRLDEKSWWAKAGSAPPSPFRDLNAIKTASEECGHCHKPSKVIFEQGWTCLKTSCDKFFVFNSAVDVEKLFYTETFLKERTAFSGMTPGPLAPPLVTEADMIIAGSSGTESSFKRGIVCPQCKGCSRRKDWSKWVCETEGCTFTHSFPFRAISVKDTMPESARHRRLQNYEREFGIKMEAKRLGAYDVFEYAVPGPEGNVVGVLRLFKSTSDVNRQPDGPDDLFQLMQERDFDLRRRPVRQSNSSGEVITNHFATNWGAPYKFVVSQSSRGFSEAPTVIIKALKRLTWAGEQTLTDVGEPFHPFNELLSIGYFEDCSIGYHDDGESTLGPTVATLSLGASATMSLRPKAKAAVGITSRNAKGTKAPIIRVTLEHGDMVIMHGSGVQQYYEHEVVPHGTLRFALTCRYIRPDMLENDAEREDARIKGALPEGHEQYKYNGDENAIFTPEEIEKAKKAARLNALMRSLNDAAAIFKAGASQGDDDERCQMRDIIGQFENGSLTHGVAGDPMRRKESAEEVDVPMPSPA
ncbi:hypothetical protein V498_06017 [Pseudogymnoascus sp. VKM F-4517 (FW-2822)]|nr:hypothetical protein V498_06017 [Pseudogymnoascus sp. VKM F-4517 (FW-2822)]